MMFTIDCDEAFAELFEADTPPDAATFWRTLASRPHVVAQLVDTGAYPELADLRAAQLDALARGGDWVRIDTDNCTVSVWIGAHNAS
jgi:hypothetical protein